MRNWTLPHGEQDGTCRLFGRLHCPRRHTKQRVRRPGDPGAGVEHQLVDQAMLSLELGSSDRHGIAPRKGAKLCPRKRSELSDRDGQAASRFAGAVQRAALTFNSAKRASGGGGPSRQGGAAPRERFGERAIASDSSLSTVNGAKICRSGAAGTSTNTKSNRPKAAAGRRKSKGRKGQRGQAMSKSQGRNA